MFISWTLTLNIRLDSLINYCCPVNNNFCKHPSKKGIQLRCLPYKKNVARFPRQRFFYSVCLLIPLQTLLRRFSCSIRCVQCRRWKSSRLHKCCYRFQPISVLLTDLCSRKPKLLLGLRRQMRTRGSR